MKTLKVLVRDLRKEIPENLMKNYEKEFLELKVKKERNSSDKENFEMKKDPDEVFLFAYEKKPKIPKVKREVTKDKIPGNPRTTFSKFQCQICQKYLHSKSSLDYHTNAHYKPTNFKCEKCQKNFINKAIFNKHYCSTCTHCDIKTSNMKSHLKRIHKIQMFTNGFECDYCGDRFILKNAFENHVKKCSMKKQVKHACDHCGKEYDLKINLRGHILTHVINLIECKFCDAKMKPKSLSTHMSSFHPNKEAKLECKKCPKTFKSLHLLNLHIKNHDKKFQCPYCDRKFPDRGQMNYHKKYHENPEDYQCKVCGLQSTSKKDLRVHMRKHEKNREKRIKCHRCDFKTDNTTTIKVHLKYHETLDEKLKNLPDAIKCEKCPSVLNNQKSYQYHVQRYHGKQKDFKFQCDLCDVKYLNLSELRRHVQRKHQTK